MFAWPRRGERNIVSAGHRAGIVVGSGTAARGIYGNGGGGPSAWRAAVSGTCTGFGARSKMGTNGGDLRGRSLSGVAPWRGGNHGFSGQRANDRQTTRASDGEAFCRARPAGRRNERCAGKL